MADCNYEDHKWKLSSTGHMSVCSICDTQSDVEAYYIYELAAKDEQLTQAQGRIAEDEVDEINNRFDDLGIPESTLLGRLNLLEGSYDAEINTLNNIAKKYEQEADKLEAELTRLNNNIDTLKARKG